MNDFFRGMGSALNLFPDDKGRKNVEIPTHSDYEAIHKDLEKISNDMCETLDIVV